MCAALAARHLVSRVLVLERAPEHMRGGNTRHVRNVRCGHASPSRIFSRDYYAGEPLAELIRLRGGTTRHVRNARCAQASPDRFISGAYSEEELLEDVIGVTGGPANLDLA